MIRTRTITIFLLGLILTAAGLRFDQRPLYPAAVYAMLVSAASMGFLTGWRWKIGTDIGAAAIGVTLALLAVSRATPAPDPTMIVWYAGRSVAIEGTVTQRPEHGVRQSIYVVEADKVTTNEGEFPVSGKIRLTDRGGWPRVPYGGRIFAKGKLEKPQSSGDFRYDLYLSVQDIAVTLDTWEIFRLPGENGNIFLGSLQSMRGWVEGTIQRLYGEPHSSLLMGLLTGARSEMPQDLKDDLKTTGLTHLVAISGFNITLLLTIIDQALFWLPFRWRLLPGAFAITAFTLFVGGSASVVRAAVMGVLGMLAAHSGRIANPRLMILWTLAIMILWNPRQLWYDPGFHLSFLALFGISEISPLLEPLFKKIPATLGLRDALQLSLAAQIATAPWSAYLFGQTSLIAPVSNLFAPPLVPIAMLLGTVSVATSALHEQLGLLTGAIAFLPLQGIVLTARIFAKVPGAALAWKGNIYVTIVAYGVMGLLVAFRDWKKKRGLSDGV